jgi:hypothetical protein
MTAIRFEIKISKVVGEVSEKHKQQASDLY